MTPRSRPASQSGRKDQQLPPCSPLADPPGPKNNLPGLEAANYAAYDLQIMPAEPQSGASWLDEASPAR